MERGLRSELRSFFLKTALVLGPSSVALFVLNIVLLGHVSEAGWNCVIDKRNVK